MSDQVFPAVLEVPHGLHDEGRPSKQTRVLLILSAGLQAVHSGGNGDVVSWSLQCRPSGDLVVLMWAGRIALARGVYIRPDNLNHSIYILPMSSYRLIPRSAVSVPSTSCPVWT